MRARTFGGLAVLILLSSCGGTSGGDGGGTEGGGGAGGGGSGPPPVEWEPCIFESGRGECASFEVPVDRDDPASPTLPFFVRRLPAEGTPRGQLWLLEGGPGFGGYGLPYLGTYLQDLGYDIYMPDYRGVGRSAHLGCGGGDDVSETCLAATGARWGDDLVHFSTADAVRDIGDVIERLRHPGETILVWGTSYGTVALNRYLHLFPDQADAVVLDSSCPGAGCDLTDSEGDVERTARDVAALCAADEFCRGKLGADPWGTITAVVERVEAGHCAAATTRSIRPVLASLFGPLHLPSVGLAAVYRLERCTDADAAAVGRLVTIVAGVGRTAQAIRDTPSQSLQLYYQIVFNELWDAALTEDELAEREAGLVLRTGAVRASVDLEARWPWERYTVPDELRGWPRTTRPLLVLNGTLDAQTRHDRMADARAFYTGAHQHVVIVPYAGHGVIFRSQPASDEPGAEPCGLELTRAFLTDPAAPLDTSCVDAQRPPDFSTAPNPSYWFGTPDLWENDASRSPPGRFEDLPPYLQLELERGRRDPRP